MGSRCTDTALDGSGAGESYGRDDGRWVGPVSAIGTFEEATPLAWRSLSFTERATRPLEPCEAHDGAFSESRLGGGNGAPQRLDCASDSSYMQCTWYCTQNELTRAETSELPCVGLARLLARICPLQRLLPRPSTLVRLGTTVRRRPGPDLASLESLLRPPTVTLLGMLAVCRAREVFERFREQGKLRVEGIF